MPERPLETVWPPAPETGKLERRVENTLITSDAGKTILTDISGKPRSKMRIVALFANIGLLGAFLNLVHSAFKHHNVALINGALHVLNWFDAAMVLGYLVVILMYNAVTVPLLIKVGRPYTVEIDRAAKTLQTSIGALWQYDHLTSIGISTYDKRMSRWTVSLNYKALPGLNARLTWGKRLEGTSAVALCDTHQEADEVARAVAEVLRVPLSE